MHKPTKSPKREESPEKNIVQSKIKTANKIQRSVRYFKFAPQFLELCETFHTLNKSTIS